MLPEQLAAQGGDDDCLEEDAPWPLGHGGDDDCLEDDAAGFSRLVRTIALKDDAPSRLRDGGEDALLRTMLPGWEQPGW